MEWDLGLLGGRVYTNAILHGGPTLKISDAWRGGASRGVVHSSVPEKPNDQQSSEGRPTMEATPHRVALTAAIVVGVVIGVGVAVLTQDVILGIAIGAGFIAIVPRIIKIWSAPKAQARGPS